MGSIGDCYDNAMIESFWARMQTELLNRVASSRVVYESELIGVTGVS
jgi:transposase InsO family protein